MTICTIIKYKQQLFTTKSNYCDFVVCAFDEKNQPMFMHQRIVPDQAHWDRVAPKLETFWRVCILPEILGRWYTRKIDLSSFAEKRTGDCFCGMDDDKPTVKCSNQSCQISTFHLSCLAVDSIPKTWYCPNCRKLPEFKPSKRQKTNLEDRNELACLMESICVCKQKASKDDRLLKCTIENCENGLFFHMACLNYKRMPNNYKTIWVCPKCKLDKKTRTESKSKSLLQDICSDMNPVDKTDVLQSSALCSDNELFDNYENDITDNDIVYVGSFPSTTPFNKTSSLGVLTEKDFDVVGSPTGWLDCTIIHQAQLYLQQLNTGIKGLQRPVLGPVRSFDIVRGDFVQILHTGDKHWVCISSIGCLSGEVNLYDSLFHNIIEDEVKEQVYDLTAENDITLVVVPVQQQQNGSDCGVFSIAFATCLIFGMLPETVQFNVPAMRPHLLRCLKAGKMELFPTL